MGCPRGAGHTRCDGNGGQGMETSTPQTRDDELVRRVHSCFKPFRARYILLVLTDDELRIIPNPHDALIIARIKRMSAQRLRSFDAYIPINAIEQRNYYRAQTEWIAHEQYLLTRRLGRTPTHAELSADFIHAQNGQRFRAYYVLKYPERMKCEQRKYNVPA
jgi:hypothetical protein